MLEILRLVVRILVGWCGVSLILGGLWASLAAARTRPNLPTIAIAATLILLGICLLWGAVTLL